MIDYDVGRWGLSTIFRRRGSVMPKGLCWAIPNAIIGIVLHRVFHPDVDEELRMDDPTPRLGVKTHMDGVNIIWSGYTMVLGFLIVFRNTQAYARFWEGATLINQVRGEWFNAVSSLFAFCRKDSDPHDTVFEFQNLLVRLSSMLYCAALQQVCALEDDTLEILSPAGMSLESLDFLQTANDRCEVLLQWIQRLIVEASQAQVVDIPAPILSRAFQELSRGIVNLNNARKIRDIPFPYPYFQMIAWMLLGHFAMTPLLASQVIEAWWWCGSICFFVTFAFWSMFYIAIEIDSPFGDGWNDLQVAEMQEDFNRSLLTLLEPLAQMPPTLELRRSGPFPSVVKSDTTFVNNTGGRMNVNGIRRTLASRTMPIKADSFDRTSSMSSGVVGTSEEQEMNDDSGREHARPLAPSHAKLRSRAQFQHCRRGSYDYTARRGSRDSTTQRVSSLGSSAPYHGDSVRQEYSRDSSSESARISNGGQRPLKPALTVRIQDDTSRRNSNPPPSESPPVPLPQSPSVSLISPPLPLLSSGAGEEQTSS